MLEIQSADSFNSDKVISYPEAIRIIKQAKEAGNTVGLCHGGFDLLHPGHVQHINSARKLCDVLIVSLTSDRFVRSRKGDNRPIYDEKLRTYMIANLTCVDHVVISDFNTGIEVINSLQPTYYIKGPDYIDKNHDEINNEKEAISAVGGEMRYTNDPKLSTTHIIRYIREYF